MTKASNAKQHPQQSHAFLISVEMGREMDEISQHNVTARNSFWRKISKDISQSKVGSFARAVSSAFGNLKVCQSGREKAKRIVRNNGYSKEVIPSAPTEFVYPGDRYLSNVEIQKQLEIIEERFNKQSQIINRFKVLLPFTISEEFTNTTKANHVRSLPSIQDLTTTTEKRFEAIENLVKEIHERRQHKEKTVFGKVVRSAFGRLMNGGRKVKKVEEDEGCFEEVTLPAPLEFVYPRDRYLSNAETLKQLEVIEERFNRQTQILNRYKEKCSESARTNYVYESSNKADTNNNTMTTEARFAAIDNLVKQIQDRRTKMENKRA